MARRSRQTRPRDRSRDTTPEAPERPRRSWFTEERIAANTEQNANIRVTRAPIWMLRRFGLPLTPEEEAQEAREQEAEEERLPDDTPPGGAPAPPIPGEADAHD